MQNDLDAQIQAQTEALRSYATELQQIQQAIVKASTEPIAAWYDTAVPHWCKAETARIETLGQEGVRQLKADLAVRREQVLRDLPSWLSQIQWPPMPSSADQGYARGVDPLRHLREGIESVKKSYNEVLGRILGFVAPVLRKHSMDSARRNFERSSSGTDVLQGRHLEHFEYGEELNSLFTNYGQVLYNAHQLSLGLADLRVAKAKANADALWDQS